MPQDAFTISYIAKELNGLLCGGKISKITQPARDELTFIIYTRRGNVKLDMGFSAKTCRVTLSGVEREAPKTAPNFCMLLRKHLQNAEITAVNCVADERIIYFDFKQVTDFASSDLRLYAEIMGKYSNAVLTENGKILGALKTNSIAENTKRLLFTGVDYALPEPQDKVSPRDISALSALEFTGGDLARFLAEKVRGIAFVTAQDIADFCSGKFNAEMINRYICGGQCSPAVVFQSGKPVDFKAVARAGEGVDYPTVLDAQKAFYDRVISENDVENQRKKLLSALAAAIKKTEKRLANIRDKLLECKDAESVKLKGELITANIYSIRRGQESFEAVNYYDEAGGKIKIQLDRTLTPAQNAQKYYKRYAKLKRTAETVSAQKEETAQRCEYLYSLRAHIEKADGLADLSECADELEEAEVIKRAAVKGKKKAPQPFRSYICGTFRIIAGRNNIQNDKLLKSISPEDLWLHTQGYHSCHVAIICEGRKVPANVLEVAAQICAHYSDGAAGNKIPVDYTRRKYVKKPPKSAAGFVIYTDYRTVLVDPDPHFSLLKD